MVKNLRKIIFIILLIFLSACTKEVLEPSDLSVVEEKTCKELPDLVLTSITAPENMTTGNSYTITAKFSLDSPNCSMGSYELLLYQDGKVVNKKNIPNMEAAEYTIEWKAVAGDHILMVIAGIDDRNPDNNRKALTVSVP